MTGHRSSLDLVREFHTTYGQPIATRPSLDDAALNKLRVDLLQEELSEFAVALHEGDTLGVLDALTDLQYVLDGAYLSLGFASMKDAALAEVHRSNLSKLGEDGKPIYREDGKVMKGPNYTPPDLRSILALYARGPIAWPPLEEIIEWDVGDVATRRHDLIKTGDPDSFPQIQDASGEVALAYCRVCKRGEAELAPTCPGVP